MLPGVGAFGAAAAQLRARGLFEPLRERIAAGQPTLAICLGLQLLAERSDESPGALGLGILDEPVERLSGSVRVPQLGWNLVTGLGEPGFAYFAHSYRVSRPPTGFQIGWTDHGGPVIAAVRRGAVLGCQFHPELSGDWGEALIRSWLEAT